MRFHSAIVELVFPPTHSHVPAANPQTDPSTFPFPPLFSKQNEEEKDDDDIDDDPLRTILT